MIKYTLLQPAGGGHCNRKYWKTQVRKMQICNRTFCMTQVRICRAGICKYGKR